MSSLRFIGSLLGRLTKLRYLLFGGAIAGGTSAYQTFESWKDKLPGLSWMKDYFPDNEQLNELKQKFLDYTNSVEMPRMPDFKGYFPEEYPSKLNYKQLQQLESAKIEELHNQMMTQQVGCFNIEFQKEMDRLKRDNRELRKSLMLKHAKDSKKRRLKRSLIDMYSEVLDELADFDSSYNIQDHLPRVVVVGDQSSGKTSVLEMIAQARIFPRGSGEMMTRSPVKVTLSEGPYHVAKFKDGLKEYDLTKESELEALRQEIEMRMKSSVSDGRTVSGETISLTVKGPGLHRIVLVDLPGIISTVTTGMAGDTKDRIRQICKQHMENPNAIILCIQDGSIDAERSNVTDLVSSMDPSGKRTIFVLTKVDVAENNQYNPDRIRKILEGRLFPMKALGYFAVVTGKGNNNDSIQDIKDYEERFFKSSSLFKNGVLKSSQMTTYNLSLAVSKCFWKMVREAIDQQADSFKAMRFNLETEWKNTFPKNRELDRDELFEKARGEILDEVINLSLIPPQHWEETFRKNLWKSFSDEVFNNIYLPASLVFNTTVDIKLKKWAEKSLPSLSVQVGRATVQSEFRKLLLPDKTDGDPIFNEIKSEVSKEQHAWDKKAEESLRVIQMNTLEDRDISDKSQWDSAIKFMEVVVKEELVKAEQDFNKMIGPSKRDQWLHWMASRTEEENLRRAVVRELEKLIVGKVKMPIELSKDDLTAIRKNLENQSVQVDDVIIKDTWSRVHKLTSLRKAMSQTVECRRGFYYYKKGYMDDETANCSDVVFFWRIERMLQATTNALRQHQRIKNALNEIGDDKSKLEMILNGKRVSLAEELKRVRQIQELLEEFIQALNKEKP
ncbi:hypothetical protein HELRODRAFT_75114 [Helobdella robusta]|uniref:Dynamin-like GTPase OPA1, mitochondrial n=1 Tax=Helobdella robusta TaxID=6412 RepID=T1G210_HELRO|nr:hypothetical protein HELRODRAFT_75114 [Helobdella robusta]ESO08202.1 hypothetical protein HELRODRAFT_75114 [Helobdella robusta]